MEFLDYRAAGLLTLALVAVFVLIRWRLRNVPTLIEIVQATFGFLAILGGTAIGAVFLLTKPPAIDLLSTDSLGLAGLITVVCTFYSGITQLIALLSVRQAPTPPPDTTTTNENESG